MDFGADTVLALVGIAIPILAFLWEFVFVGRHRLGYRVQMDTPVTGEVAPVMTGALDLLRGTTGDLRDLSIVLVRIENSGTSAIEPSDYQVPIDNVGLHLNFAGRRVVGMAVTELSDRDLTARLGPNSGIAVREEDGGHKGVIDLPKVPLDRGDHYKILAILRRTTPAAHASDEYPAPTLTGKIKRGSITETRSRTGVPRTVLVLIGFLVAVIVVQFVVALRQSPADPLDCAGGKLTLVGSSAFEPVMREAAKQYSARCSDTDFSFDFEGTERGLDRITESGPNPELLAISDGPKGAGYPALLPRPLALSLFTLIVHKDLGISDLTADQVDALFDGRIKNWNQVGGPNLPVVLVNRTPGSGTRNIFERQLLGGAQPERPHQSCTAIKDTSGTYCDVPVTKDMHKAVAEIPGAIGYSELSEAVAANMRTVTINGVAAGRQQAIDRSYPFWGVEYAYSNGDLPADSLAGSFLHYLTDNVGTEVLRAHGNEPCRSTLLGADRCAPGQ